MSLENKTIVITGASSGIGARTAEMAKERGAKVIGVDLNPPSNKLDGFVEADVSKPASIAEAAKALPDGIDGLCNSAGLPPTRGAANVVTVNFLGLRELTEALVPKLADNASIVNLSSLAGLEWAEHKDAVKAVLDLRDFSQAQAFCDEHGVTDERCYFFSKEAVNVWTMMNRWTWRERGIRMNSVCPGPVETPIFPEFVASLGERVEEDMRVMDRPGTPDDVAPVACFLLSSDSQWIRGVNLACDGGMHSHILMHMHGFEQD